MSENAITIICAVLLLGYIIFGIVRRLREWSYNNAQPVESVKARSLYKHTGDDPPSVLFFGVFETEDGKILKFRLSNGEYTNLPTATWGVLTFQGTRFIGFKRV